MVRKINREIRAYIFQILLTLTLLIISFICLNNNRFAKISVASEYPLEVSVEKDVDAVLESMDLLNKDTIYVKNPNNKSTTFRIKMVVDDSKSLEDMDIYVDDIEYDNIERVDDHYIIDLGNYDLGAYEEKSYTSIFKGDPFTNTLTHFDYDITTY